MIIVLAIMMSTNSWDIRLPVVLKCGHKTPTLDFRHPLIYYCFITARRLQYSNVRFANGSSRVSYNNECVKNNIRPVGIKICQYKLSITISSDMLRVRSTLEWTAGRLFF